MRPWTSAGGAVASMAVKGSRIVYWCVAPAGTNHESPALNSESVLPDRVSALFAGRLNVELTDARRRFDLLNFYGKFEQIVIFILTVLIAVFVIFAVWNLAQRRQSGHPHRGRQQYQHAVQRHHSRRHRHDGADQGRHRHTDPVRRQYLHRRHHDLGWHFADRQRRHLRFACRQCHR